MANEIPWTYSEFVTQHGKISDDGFLYLQDKDNPVENDQRSRSAAGVFETQTYLSTVWTTTGSEILDTTSQDFMPLKNVAELANSPLRITADGLYTSEKIRTDASTIEVGRGFRLSNRGGFLATESDTTGTEFLVPDYPVDDTGSGNLTKAARGPLIVRKVTQADDSQTLLNVTSYNVTPGEDGDIIALYLNFANPVTNFRFTVLSDITGLPIHDYPTEGDILDGTGTSFGAGEQRIELTSPLAELSAVPITVNLFADGDIDLKGSLTDPWRAIDEQVITSYVVLDAENSAPESVSTSVIGDCVIVANGTTAIDIPAGNARQVSIDANGAPTVTNFSWGAMLNQTLPDIVANSSTRVMITPAGAFLPVNGAYSGGEVRDNAVLGIVVHTDTTIDSVIASNFQSEEIYSQQMDLNSALGIMAVNGNEVTVSPNANLTISKTAGQMHTLAGGTAQGSRTQNIVDISPENPAHFVRILGSAGYDVETADTTSIDPGFYDLAGVKTAVGGGANQSSIQYVFQSASPDASPSLIVMYGQDTFINLDSAVLNAGISIPSVPSIVEGVTNLIGIICLRKDATDLTDPLQAAFLGGVKFGTSLSNGLNGSISGGGDVNGPASATVDEIATLASTTALKSDADITANAGTLRRITAAGGLSVLAQNGVSGVNVTNTSVNTVARDATGSNTTTLDLVASSGGSFGGVESTVNSGAVPAGIKFFDNLGALIAGLYTSQAQDRTFVSHGGTEASPAASVQLTDSVIIGSFDAGNSSITLNELGVVALGAHTDLNLTSGNNVNVTATEDITWGNGTTSVDINNTTGNITLTTTTGNLSVFNGKARLFNDAGTPGYLLEDAIEDVRGGVERIATGTRMFLGDGVAAPDASVTCKNNSVDIEPKAIIGGGGTELARGILQVGDLFSDPGDFTADLNCPAVFTANNNNGGNTPAAAETVLLLTRSGVSAEAYGNVFRVDLSRYENIGTTSRTKVDFRLSHAGLTPEGNATPVQMSMYSSGLIEIPGTLTVGGQPIVPVASRQTMLFKTVIQNSVALTLGTDKDITTGTSSEYVVDGVAGTAPFTGGVFTFPAGSAGVYSFFCNVGESRRGNTAYDQDDRVITMLSINDVTYQTGDESSVIWGRALNRNGCSMSAPITIADGDTVRIKTDTTTSGWTMDGLVWGFTKIND